MNMKSSKIIKIPIRIIECIYGKGNLDNAADDLIEIIGLCSDFPNQIKYKIEIDSVNDNPCRFLQYQIKKTNFFLEL